MNVAIMGATSHIAKGLLAGFGRDPEVQLFLFVRDRGPLDAFLQADLPEQRERFHVHCGYERFADLPYDVIVNCIGVPPRGAGDFDFSRYFSVTEAFDGLAIDYLQRVNSDGLYLCFSSGAVYGRGFHEAATDATVNAIRVNGVTPEDYYGITRLNAEAKHRAFADLRIIDLRVFSYFSRFADVKQRYFVTDLIRAIRAGETFITTADSMVRDYLHPDDLFAAVGRCIASSRLNAAIDICSARPAAKDEILSGFEREYGLKYSFGDPSHARSATGAKAAYYSTANHAARLGHRSHYSSLETLLVEAGPLLQPS